MVTHPPDPTVGLATGAPAAVPRVGPERFRDDINGLRAVAVLAVILFHFQIPGFGGGFVGVDVFFVISGYLMTEILVDGLRRPAFRVWRFYLQRVARILPALLVVTAAVLAFGYVALLPDPFLRTAHEALWSITFAVNLHFATVTGYFAQASALSWFLHCWSLAVECQFYLVYPLLLYVSGRFGGARGQVGTVVALAAASALFSWIATRHDATVAFYLVLSRFWEFAIGGLVAFAPPAGRGRSAAAVVGLALIATAIVGFGARLRYPGLWPALPCLGAAMVVWARADMPLLGNGIAQFLGTTSYSVYLWHWPLWLASRYLWGGEGPFTALVLFLLTLGIGWLSFRFVETPARGLVKRGLRRPLLAGVVAYACVGVACGFVIVGSGLPDRIPDDMQRAMPQADPLDGWRSRSCFLYADQTFSDFSNDCFPGAAGGDPARAGKSRLFIWGNSHAADLVPGVTHQPWAADLAISQATASICGPLADGVDSAQRNCDGLRASIGRLIEASRPEAVLISAFILPSPLWTEDQALARLRTTEEHLTAEVARLLRVGIGKVLVVGPIPEWDLPLPEVVYRSRFRVFEAGLDGSTPSQFARLKTFDQGLRRAAEAAGGRYVSLVDGLCQGDVCRTRVPTAIGPALIQFDLAHLTRAGSDWVANQLIGPALGEPISAFETIRPGTVLDFKAGAAGARYLAANWMPPEPWGTWNRSGRTGVVSLPILGSWTPSRLTVTFWGALGATLPRERLWLRIDGDPPVPLEVDLANPIITSSVTLGPGARAALAASGYVTVSFWAPDAKSPRELGLNADTRVLGFGLRQVRLD